MRNYRNEEKFLLSLTYVLKDNKKIQQKVKKEYKQIKLIDNTLPLYIYIYIWKNI